MTETVSRSGDIGSGALSRPAGSARGQIRKSRARMRTSGLGFLLLLPAFVLLIVFFFAPIVLTTIFSFTNMSSATGISSGAYVISPNLLRNLSFSGVDADVLEPLGQEIVVVDDASIEAARAAGLDSRFLAEIESRFTGRQFDSKLEFERELRQLPSHPRRTRELKLAVEPFARSILNIRFATRSAAQEAIETMAPGLEAQTTRQILDRAYTGWVWTTDNFTRLASQPDTLRIVFNTFFYVGVTLAFNVLVGLFLALTLFYLPQGQASFFSALWLLPRITPIVIYTIMWKWFTWDGGFLATLAGMVGLPSFNYMKGSVPSAWTIVILVNGFVGASFGMILFTGALRAIPRQQLWASEVDGATRWQQVRYIILPQMRWPIMFVTSYQSLSLLSSYEAIWLTTDGGPGNTTMVWALQSFRIALQNYTGNLQYGLGAAMALVLVIAGIVLSIIFLRLFRFGQLVDKPKIEY